MTIFMDLQTSRIIHAIEGRSYEAVSPFLRELARRAKKLQAELDHQEKRYLKGSRYLFLYNYSNLTDDQKRKLHVLLDANKPLFYMYNTKELLRYFWQFKTAERAREFLYLWCHDALTSGIKPFIRLGLTINRFKEQILNYFKHPITNAVVEGINNKIKTLKRQAYEFRDTKYFKLRLYHLHRSRYLFAG